MSDERIVAAENVASQYQVSRQDQDQFAVTSQKRTQLSLQNNKFSEEIVPVRVSVRGGEVFITKDEGPRANTSMEGLARLRPVFLRENGTVTAGNACTFGDGAAAVVLASEGIVKSRSLKPLARIVGISQSGCDPKLMGIGPISAIKNLFSKIGWTKDDVDLFEINEAFAAQAVAVCRELGLDPEKVNVNGGAIAIGHPIGASGARILVTLLTVLKQQGKTKGVASLCVGGGMGVAIAVERL